MSDDSMFTNKEVNVDYSQRCDEMSFSTFIGASIKLQDSHYNASARIPPHFKVYCSACELYHLSTRWFETSSTMVYPTF